MAPTKDLALEALRLKTVVWVVGLATVGLIFDGYDLVVYGTVVSTFLRDPTQIGDGDPRSRRARWAATRWSACSSGPCSRAASATSWAGAR